MPSDDDSGWADAKLDGCREFGQLMAVSAGDDDAPRPPPAVTQEQTRDVSSEDRDPIRTVADVGEGAPAERRERASAHLRAESPSALQRVWRVASGLPGMVTFIATVIGLLLALGVIRPFGAQSAPDAVAGALRNAREANTVSERTTLTINVAVRKTPVIVTSDSTVDLVRKTRPRARRLIARPRPRSLQDTRARH